MEVEVKKLKEQMQELVDRLSRHEQRVASLEREIAEQACAQTESHAELLSEPLLQRARSKQMFYVPKKQRNKKIIMVVSAATGLLLLCCYYVASWL